MRSWPFKSIKYIASLSFSTAEFNLALQKLLVMSILAWTRDTIVFNLFPAFLSSKHLRTVLFYPSFYYLLVKLLIMPRTDFVVHNCCFVHGFCINSETMLNKLQKGNTGKNVDLTVEALVDKHFLLFFFLYATS